MLTRADHLCRAHIHREAAVASRRRKSCVETGISRADVRLAATHAWRTWKAMQSHEVAADCAARWQDELTRWPAGLAQAMGEDDVVELALEWSATWMTLDGLSDRCERLFELVIPAPA